MLLPMLALFATSDAALPPAPPREFRAVWVATVDNIDWPSKKSLPVDQAKSELVAILDRARQLRLNAVIFQVRPMADALYESKLEPWSEFLTGTQGTAPKPLWDPLRFAVDEAHKRGLELHAWFNPFRAWHPAAKSTPAKDDVMVAHPNWVKNYGGFKWMDPGDSAVRTHTLQVIEDVVDRYDIDGVHIDDYFYPYPIKGQDFPDDPSYFAYKASGGKLARSDWRRANVDSFVHEMYDLVKKRKPWVKVGISPFGIYRPGVPVGIQSQVDQYDGLYADARKWLAKGWCDYFTPQLYWRISQTHQSYPTLLRWWQSQNLLNRHLWPGNFASQLFTGANWPQEELLEQINLTRHSPGVEGNVFFSMKAFMSDSKGINEALEKGPYAHGALVPESPWLGGSKEKAPVLEDVDVKPEWQATVSAPKGVIQLALWTRYGGEWVLQPPCSPGRISCRATNESGFPLNEVAVASVDRYGVVGDYATWTP